MQSRMNTILQRILLNKVYWAIESPWGIKFVVHVVSFEKGIKGRCRK